MGAAEKSYLRRAVEGVALFAIVRGIFYALGDHGIHPDLWVAKLIDEAATVASGSTQAVAWIASGLLGLLGVFLLEKYVWPKLPPSPGMIRMTGRANVRRMPAIDSVGETKVQKTGLAEILLAGPWILNFNPNHSEGKKEISFLANGRVGTGANSNEYRWQLLDGTLRIFRETGALQNDFKFDEQSGNFVCTNNSFAKGYKGQLIYRHPSAPKQNPPESSLKDAAIVAYRRLQGTPFVSELDLMERTPSGRIRETMRQIVARGLACGVRWPNEALEPILNDRRNLAVLNDAGDLAFPGETEALITGVIVKPEDLDRFIALFSENI
jgi:hypothetical protein